MSVNLYKDVAELYDSDNRNIIKDDIDFYLSMVSKKSKNILELGCGTGRIIIPLLMKTNVKIFGLDLSQSMLDVLEKKLRKFTYYKNYDNLDIRKGDFSSFNYNELFDLIILPYRNFQSLYDIDKALNCLKCCAKHLSSRGKIVINTFDPKNNMTEDWIREETVNWINFDAELTECVIGTDNRHRIDLNNNIIFVHLNYYKIKIGEKIEKFQESLILKYYYFEALRELILNSGLQITKKYGYYDKRPLFKGSEYILICERTK